jgi:glutathione peroxidase
VFGRILKAAGITAIMAAFAVNPAAAETSGTASGKGAGAANQSIYSIPIDPMDVEGSTTATSLAPYKGKVLLIVNVASKCGFTKQYEGLEALYEKHKDDGLVVLGFPSNDFKGQEPGTEKEIVEFCKGRFGVSFPLFGKVHVTGDEKAPLYKYLTEGDHPGKGEVTWNFNKFLVDREGNVVAHYESKVTPEDPVLNAQLGVLLAGK